MLGLGVPGVIEESPVVVAWLPGLADILNSLLRVPMAVGGIVAIILEFILPGRMSGEEIEAVMRGEKVG
jgi:xanthine/uracil permease